jgi:hypothetical protein
MESSIVESLSVSTTPSVGCFVGTTDIVDIAYVIDIACVISVILSRVYYSNVV